MDELINVREAAVRLFLGASAGEILNREPFQGQVLPGPELAAALKRTVNSFQRTAITPDGMHVDYERLRESEIYHFYRTALTPQLRTLDLRTLESRAERLAFWINLYNALVIDAVIAYNVRRSVQERMAGLAFFRAAAYNVSGLRYSCEDIEHGILRANRGNPFIPGVMFKSDDSRLRWIISPPDRRIHFALNCASRSCPPIDFYTADKIDEQLTLATRNFVATDTEVFPQHGEIHLSRLYSWYADDFGGKAGLLDFIVRYLPDDERRHYLQLNPLTRVVYRPYDWGLNI